MKLPVCVEAGMTIEKLLQATPDFHQQHIHVTFPSKKKDKDGLVYVGHIGLKGGGNSVSASSSDIFDIPETIASTAEAQIGSDYWRYHTRRRNFPANTNKCNLFVAEVQK